MFGPTVAFIGLGAMGYQMAKRLATMPVSPDGLPSSLKDPEDLRGARLHRGREMHRGMQEHILRNVLVWNRTPETAAQHTKEFHSLDISNEPFHADNVGACSVVLMCLPTSDITFKIVQQMAPHLKDNCILVDCCTGHPTISQEMALWLENERPGIRYVDCPISGGPGGASQGTLAAFLGGEPAAAEAAMPHIKAFAANVVYLGPVGSGHAVKAVNNACNVSNLLCLHEGLLALKKMGVNPSAALEVINKSSGRSLMSQARVPEEVVTGDFNYGFKLGLMAKDVGIATDILDKYFPSAKIYRNTAKMHLDAMAAGTVTFDSDYTEIVKHQEVQAGVQLRKEPEPESDADEEPAKTGLPNEEQLAALSAQLQAVLNENASLRADLQSVKAADRSSA